jgi:hypothetical protein
MNLLSVQHKESCLIIVTVPGQVRLVFIASSVKAERHFSDRVRQHACVSCSREGSQDRNDDS